MQNSRLVRILKSFSRAEISQLESFIKSDFLNKLSVFGIHRHSSREKIIQLFDVLKKEYPDFRIDKLNRVRIFDKLFREEKYNDTKFRGLRNDLYSIIEIYLSIIDLFDNPLHPQLHLINQLEKRKQKKLLSSSIDGAINLLNEEKIRNEDLYMQEFQLLQKKWIESMKELYLGKSEKSFAFFEKGIESSSKSFLITMLKQLSYYIHYKNRLNIEIDINLHENLYQYLKTNGISYLKDEILFTWFNILSLHNDSNISPNGLSELKNRIEKLKNNFTEDDFKYLMLEIFNYCIRQFKTGNESYKVLLALIFKERLDNGLFLDEGYINERAYSGNTALALRLGEYELAKDFIIKYKDNLIPENRENVFNFSYGLYLYSIKDFDNSLEYLARVNSQDYYYASEVYNTQLKIYFETNAFESAISKIDSYKHFLNSNKLIPGDSVLMNLNFLKFYEDLLKNKEGSNKVSKEVLMNKISKTKNLSYRGWLVNSIKKLKVRGGKKKNKL